MRTLLALPLLLSLGCAEDPGAVSARAYVDVLSPLLQENALLADRILVAAAGLHDEQLSITEVSTAWATDVAPLAAHLHAQAEVVQAPADWSAAHTKLVAIWGDRATAYERVAGAWEARDAKQWTDAGMMAYEAKVAEETWMLETNTRLRTFRLGIDQFP